MGLIFRLFPVIFIPCLISQVSAAPRLRLSNTAVGPISVQQGANTTAPQVEASNTGDGQLNLRLTSSVTWIEPTAGPSGPCSLRGTCIPILFNLRTAGLAAGTYTGFVTVADPAAIDAPQTISVTVQVGGGVPARADLFVAPNGSTAELRFQTNSALGSQVTTQSGGDWLALSLDGGGSFRFNAPYRIVATHLQGMAEGTYNGSIVTTGSSVAAENRTVPVSLRVTSQPIARSSAPNVFFRLPPNGPRQTQFVAVSNSGLGVLGVTGATVTTASGGNWLTAEKPANFGGVAISANATGVAAGSYQGTVTVTSNAVNTLTIPVQLDVVAAGAPVAFFEGVVNNATFEAGDAVSQGGIVAIFGEQFTTREATSASALPLQNEMAGTRVFVNGQPAPIYYLSAGQINFQIPYEAQPGDGVVRIEREGQRSNDVSVRIARRVPRLLRLGIANYGIVVNQDNTFPMPPTPGLNARRARIGETLVIYAIGLGPTAPAAVTGAGAPASPLAAVPGTVRVNFGIRGPFGGGNTQATPLFAGLTPNFVGLYQLNVTIPADTPRGDAVQISVETEDGSSNPVTIAIE